MLLAFLRNSSIGIDKEQGVSLIKVSLQKQKSKTKTGQVLSLIQYARSPSASSRYGQTLSLSTQGSLHLY